MSLLKMGGVCMMQQFLSALGYQFKNPALLRRALTHPSMGPEDNQRLEFLGDAVLQYIMSDILYQSHPDCHEGQLTHLRAYTLSLHDALPIWIGRASCRERVYGRLLLSH